MDTTAPAPMQALAHHTDRQHVMAALVEIGRSLGRLEDQQTSLLGTDRAGFYQATTGPMLRALYGWADAHLACLSPQDAWTFCDAVAPAPMIDRLLAAWDRPTEDDPDQAVLRRVYGHARAHLPALGDKPWHAKKGWKHAERSPHMLLELGTSSLARLLEDGLDPLLAITRNDLATLVLMHDLPALDVAWSTHAPRKNPAYAHWEGKGFHLPKRVGAKGASWIHKALREGFSSAKFDHARTWVDHRGVGGPLYLAFLLAWGSSPGTMAPEEHAFGGPHPNWAPLLEVLARPADSRSAHHKMQVAAFLQQVPTIEGILRMGRLPDDPMGFAPDPTGTTQAA